MARLVIIFLITFVSVGECQRVERIPVQDVYWVTAYKCSHTEGKWTGSRGSVYINASHIYVAAEKVYYREELKTNFWDKQNLIYLGSRSVLVVSGTRILWQRPDKHIVIFYRHNPEIKKT